MKFTDLQSILDAVRNIEKKELAEALGKHGGSYTFPDGEDHPGIEFWDEFKGPKSGDADVVETDKDGNILISVTDEDTDAYRIDADCVYPGQLSAITAALPEPQAEPAR